MPKTLAIKREVIEDGQPETPFRRMAKKRWAKVHPQNTYSSLNRYFFLERKDFKNIFTRIKNIVKEPLFNRKKQDIK